LINPGFPYACSSANRAIAALREVEDVPDHLLLHLSPLGWEHINLIGNYVWSAADKITENYDGYRPLCSASTPCSSRREFLICPLMLQKCAFRYFWPLW
jgi:Tn3 transposase DDE domain